MKSKKAQSPSAAYYNMTPTKPHHRNGKHKATEVVVHVIQATHQRAQCRLPHAIAPIVIG